jgi:deazaflavin-dependent oxidoreductase (nitroreductase family)
LEVVGVDPSGPDVFVLSGFGEKADWLRNVRAAGKAEVTISRTTFTATCHDVPPARAAAVLARYERRNRLVAPIIRAVLSRLLGRRYDSTPEARAWLVTQLPMVALRPTDETNTAS